MKKCFMAVLVLTLMLTAIVPTRVYAELKLGSSGDDVAALQQMLYDMGYLADEIPDGQFGRKTQDALREYQQAAGVEITGVATDDLMEKIRQDWVDYLAWAAEQATIGAGNIGVPFCCIRQDENGLMITEHCQRHAELWITTQDTLCNGDADSAEYSFGAWQVEIISLYDEWISLVDEPVKAQIEADKALCIQLMANQRSSMFDSCDAAGMEPDPVNTYYRAELWMMHHAAWLCETLCSLGAER